MMNKGIPFDTLENLPSLGQIQPQRVLSPNLIKSL